MLTKWTAFYSWANHGWPSIWLQSSAGLLLVFGIGCVVQLQWSDLMFGPVLGFVCFVVGEAALAPVGWLCVTSGALLVLLTFPAQRRQITRMSALATQMPAEQRVGMMAFGAGFAFFMPIIYAAMGFVFGALGALIYNLVAKWIGGIEVEVE